jgi:hypothetical protein
MEMAGTVLNIGCTGCGSLHPRGRSLRATRAPNIGHTRGTLCRRLAPHMPVHRQLQIADRFQRLK